jgi:hypothetical protein
VSAARRGGGGPPANAAARGGVLILVAVVIGALLLARGFSDEDGLVAAGPDDGATTDTTVAEGTTDTTAAGGTTDTTAAGGTTDTTAAAAAPRPPEETRFTVLNGTTTGGAASAVGAQLSALNYVQVAASNVPGNAGADASAIYYVDGWVAEAQQMATALGVDPVVAVPIESAPFEWEMGDATLLVVIGRDGVIAPS